MNTASYKYYHGESENPFAHDFGRSFWWRVESYAAERKDAKEAGRLSASMINYLREHIWQGDAQSDTTESEFLVRAQELYSLGLWSRSYICIKAWTLSLVKAEH